MVFDRESVLKALKTVIDPELGMNIVDLGMVKDVKVDDNHLYIKVALTVPDCPLVDKIRSDIERSLETASSVNIEFTSMSEEELATVRNKLRHDSSIKGTEEDKKRRLPISNKQPVTGITKLSKTGIRTIIAIASGKGGVGKSFATGILASELARRGYLTGVLDADVTGPSMAKVFGLTQRVKGGPKGIIPAETKLGIKVMSMNLVVEKPEEALVWRGPVLNSVIRQMYTDVDWGDLHYLLIDLPPGTSDAPLTVYQSIPINGTVIISTPQDLAIMIVKKAIRMAKIMKIPVLGLIENMSYLKCPCCKESYEVFGPSKGIETAKAVDISFLGGMPLDPEIAKLSDEGKIEDYENEELKSIVDKILQNLKRPLEETSTHPQIKQTE